MLLLSVPTHRGLALVQVQYVATVSCHITHIRRRGLSNVIGWTRRSMDILLTDIVFVFHLISNYLS